jgi:tetratricopeptide (TPR) repeat protein
MIMPKKNHVFLVILVIAVVFLVFPLGKQTKSEERDKDENYYNEKGLSYFNEGFYKHTPKHKQLEALKQYKEAIKAFKKAIAMNDNYVEAHLNLARVYYVQKRFPEAAAQYEIAIKLDQCNNIDTYVNLALVYMDLKEYDKAVETLEAAKACTSDEDIIKKLDSYIDTARDVKAGKEGTSDD